MLAAVLELARSALSKARNTGFYPGLHLALGMAEFRNHNFTAAENALLSAEMRDEEHPHIVRISQFYRAMSLYQQGHLDGARGLFESTVKVMKPLPQKLTGRANINDILVWLAYKEANALIQFPATEKPAIAEK